MLIKIAEGVANEPLAVEGVREESELASESKTMHFFSQRGKGFEGHPVAGQRNLGYQRVVSYTY
jgi:hypothetical protein